MIKDFFKDKVTISIISLALIISFFSLFVSSVFSPVGVSAAELSFSFPSSFYASSVDHDLMDSYLTSLKSNPSIASFNSENLAVAFFISGSNLYTYIIDPVVQYRTTNSYYGYVFLGDYASFSVSPSSLSTYDFSVHSYDSSVTSGLSGLFYNTENWGPSGFTTCGGYIIDNNNFMAGSFSGGCSAFYYTSFVSSFESNYDEIPLPFFSLDVDDFYTWLVNNDKIAVSGGSGGVSVDGKIPAYIGVQKLKSFLQFYKSYGSSNQSFVKNIVTWFSYMNIAGQTKDNIRILKNTIDNLYQEYINYRSGTHAYWPGATKIQERNDIDTQTDNDNLILVTDDSNDSLDISILRDILRGVIAVSNNLIDGCSKIVTAINQLDFTVNVANDGGVGLDVNSIWGSGDITESENYLALTAAFMDKGVDVSAAENMEINYLENATQADSFTVSVVMPDTYVNGQFTEKTVTHTIDNTSKMYNTLILFRKLIAFAVVAYFAIRIRFELPHLIRGE